jgi:hypothetical protein
MVVVEQVAGALVVGQAATAVVLTRHHERGGLALVAQIGQPSGALSTWLSPPVMMVFARASCVTRVAS